MEVRSVRVIRLPRRGFMLVIDRYGWRLLSRGQLGDDTLRVNAVPRRVRERDLGRLL